MAITNSQSSYLDMEEELKLKMPNIVNEFLTIDMIIPKMKKLYLEGAKDMDSKWRKAIKIYADEHNIKFAPGIINELLNILNNI